MVIYAGIAERNTGPLRVNRQTRHTGWWPLMRGGARVGWRDGEVCRFALTGRSARTLSVGRVLLCARRLQSLEPFSIFLEFVPGDGEGRLVAQPQCQEQSNA